MKKILKIVMIAAALMMGAANDSQAQVFVMENESNLREDTEDVLGWPVNPQNGNGAGTDDYVPVGNGLLCLTAVTEHRVHARGSTNQYFFPFPG